MKHYRFFLGSLLVVLLGGCELGKEATMEASLGGKTVAVVSVSVANLRKDPEHSSEMGTQALLGTPLKVLKKEKDWYYVQTPEEYFGWTTDWIVLMSNDEYDRWLQRPKVVVTADFVIARQAKDDRSQAVTDLVAGDILALKNDVGTHVEVELPDGRSGYVGKERVENYALWIKRASDTPESIVATAMRFVGIPYLWGGTSAKGMDCSGFTKTVYFLNGVLLPRDASQQASVGEPVEIDTVMSHLQPGDLLFFGSPATGGKREGVSHVAISLGGFRYVHASEYVRINSFNPSDPDYSAARRKSLLRVMRIIGVGEDRGVRRLANIPSYRAHE